MKSKLVTTLLCGLLGGWGAHRFYTGKIGTAILWILTGGCFVIGNIIDMVKIAKNTMVDANGQPLKADDCPNWLPWVFVALQIIGLLTIIGGFAIFGTVIFAGILGAFGA